MNNNQLKTSSKQAQNKLAYNNKEELKELKDIKESQVSNYPTYTLKLNTLSCLQDFYNSLTSKLKIKVEPFLKISREKKQEVNDLIEKLEEIGFTESTLKNYEKLIVELFSAPKFKGEFINFYLFTIRLMEWYDDFSSELLQKTALEEEERQVDEAIKTNTKPLTEEEKRFTEAFYKQLEKTVPKESFNKFLKDKILITPVSINEEYYKVKIVYANNSTKFSANYHFQNHIDKAFSTLKMRCVSDLVFTQKNTAIITNKYERV